jgi:hypothetical protein
VCKNNIIFVFIHFNSIVSITYFIIVLLFTSVSLVASLTYIAKAYKIKIVNEVVNNLLRCVPRVCVCECVYRVRKIA